MRRLGEDRSTRMPHAALALTLRRRSHRRLSRPPRPLPVRQPPSSRSQKPGRTPWREGPLRQNALKHGLRAKLLSLPLPATTPPTSRSSPPACAAPTARRTKPRPSWSTRSRSRCGRRSPPTGWRPKRSRPWPAGGAAVPGGRAMAPGLHGSARTTPRVRAELQRAQATTRALAARYGLNPKTVAKWRGGPRPPTRPMGPARPRSTVLTEAEEAIVVEFRRRTLLPLDDVLGCLRETIPRLTRSALHRCLVRHGISRLPDDDERASKRRRFAETKIGYVHIDVCELRLGRGQALPVPGHRPGVEVRPRRLLRRQHQGQRRRLPARGRRGLPLPAPHRAHGQRHGLRRPAQEPRPLPGDRGHLRRPRLRPGVRRARHRAPPHQALPPLDERPGRADEPDRQGGHRSRPSTTPTSRRCRPTSWPSSPPTTSPSTSRRCAGGPPSRPSATPGKPTRQPSRSTRTTSSRDARIRTRR